MLLSYFDPLFDEEGDGEGGKDRTQRPLVEEPRGRVRGVPDLMGVLLGDEIVPHPLVPPGQHIAVIVIVIVVGNPTSSATSTSNHPAVVHVHEAHEINK